MFDFLITRCEHFPYLFNLTLQNGTVHREIDFDTVQRILGVEPEEYSRIDDNRCLLMY